MVRGTDYYTLVASLPAMPTSFEVERVPITFERLQERLKMLRPKDAEVIEQLRDFLVWDRQPPDKTDEAMVEHFNEIMASTGNAMARHIVAYRMDIRTIMSGLRRRRRGLGPPPRIGTWGERIRRSWDHPEFKIRWEHSWIGEVDRLLGTTETVAVERILLRATWDHWRRLAERYYFSFEVVLLYFARWEIIHRWTRRDVETGRQRFEQLIEETLSEYSSLYE
jgi:hypothetical protein